MYKRQLGNPDKALAFVKEGLRANTDFATRVELRIVEAGSRMDLGQSDEALRLLQQELEHGSGRGTRSSRIRLRYAYANLLEQTGQQEQAERWFAEQFAYLVQRLADTPEADGTGTMLDNSLVVWAKEMGDSRQHTCQGVPFVLAGGAGGRFKTGRYLKFQGESHGKLLVSLCQAMGLDTKTFGNPMVGNGPLAGLV